MEETIRRGSTGTYGLAAWPLHSVSLRCALIAAWMVGVLQGGFVMAENSDG